jgi:hypothetical protein
VGSIAFSRDYRFLSNSLQSIFHPVKIQSSKKSEYFFWQNLIFYYSSQFLACPEKQTCLWLLPAQVLVDI